MPPSPNKTSALLENFFRVVDELTIPQHNSALRSKKWRFLAEKIVMVMTTKRESRPSELPTLSRSDYSVGF